MYLCIVLSPLNEVYRFTIKWLVWRIGSRIWVTVWNTDRLKLLPAAR